MSAAGVATDKDRQTQAVRDVLAAVEESEKGNPDARRFLNGDPDAAPTKPDSHVVVNPTLQAENTEILRPNGETYYVRKIEGHHDVAVLRKCREKKIFPVFKGPPGTGKTALCEAAFGKVYTIQGTGDTDTYDFIGNWIPDPTAEGGYRYQDGPLIKAADEGVPLYVDEIAQIDPRYASILYPFMDGRGRLDTPGHPTREYVEAQPGFFVLGSFNPGVAGVRMSAALSSRFTLEVVVPSDYDLAKQFEVNAKVVKCARNMATKISGNEASWAPQLRELIAFKQIEEEFGLRFALRNILGKAPEGRDRKVFASVLQSEFGQGIIELKVT